MDKETRNRIQRATQAARALLEREFGEQLDGVFDIRMDGTIAAEPGSHLDAEHRVLRTKLVAAVEHERAAGHGPAAAVAQYLREAAFTTLNRFVALKMLEARGLAQECLSRGDQSAGFKEFTGLAPGLVQLPDHGYRLYIESFFDEIGREVRVLFDRRDPASLLWPRRQTVLDLLAILNSTELAPVWGEDETIGWVYQYFNNDEERRQMRAESQAPRNSRELAVRNQFFTPRYVVQFLTDNTLGRIWYDMRRGKTKLRDLDYLVRRPNEGFLARGEVPPEQEADADENLSQEELLKKPVHVPFRPMKDPRDLKILDPACGSGHFLLYAFDLLLVIYPEAWADGTAPRSEVTGRSLREDYPDLDAMRTEVPRLILRHNLHGIDIDARCAQIAALALWMRAQRAFKDIGIGRDARPRIQKTNIVVAEPMPGEPELRREFIATLEPKLGKLVDRVFERMELAGEAGALLRIEEDIRNAVREIYGEHGQLFRASDEQRWRQAEDDVLRALRTYAESAINGRAFQRRLFAEDAARGLGFIDSLLQKHDVVLMNPPFGKASDGCKPFYDDAYGDYKTDIGLAFLAHSANCRLAQGGQVGALVSRNFIAVDTFTRFRKDVLLGSAPIRVLMDLGYGVLDAAMVEAAAIVLAPSTAGPATFFRVLEVRDKGEAVRMHFAERSPSSGIRTYAHNCLQFRDVPLHVICYWLPRRVVQKITRLPVLTQQSAAARHGMQTTDDFRFLRLWWEVNPRDIGAHWRFLAKGGEYQPYWENLSLVVDWKDEGKVLKTYLADKRLRLQGSADWTPWLNHSEYYFVPGLTYPERTTSDFSPRILPSNAAFSGTGIAIHFANPNACLAYLAGSYSRAFKLITESFVGSGDNAFAGSAAKRYRSGLLNQLPAPLARLATDEEQSVLDCVHFYRTVAALSETLPSHRGLTTVTVDVNEWMNRLATWMLRGFGRVLTTSLAIERSVNEYLGFDKADEELLEEFVGPHPASYSAEVNLSPEMIAELWCLGVERLSALAIERHGARRQVTKKSFVANRDLELIAHLLRVDARSIVDTACRTGAPVVGVSLDDAAKSELSHAVGRVFGRWSGECFDLTESGERSSEDLFTETKPEAPATSSRDGAEVLVDDNGHASDVVRAVRAALEARWGSGDSIAAIEAALARDGLRAYLARTFFVDHVRRYSESRRQAPIYWQLATLSAGYSVWLYYHRFTRDTLYRVLNDFVAPKLKHEECKLTSLVQDAASNPTVNQLKPAGVICEIINDDGSMARVPQLLPYCQKHGLKITSIARLIEYRLQREQHIKRIQTVRLPTDYGEFKLIGYESTDMLEPHLALCKGGVGDLDENGVVIPQTEPALVRVHSECMTGDLFHSQRCECGTQLITAIEMIEKAGRGALVYLRQEGRGIGLANKLRAYKLQEQGLDTVDANVQLGFLPDKRDYGMGAQILRDLGLTHVRILTNNPKKVSRLEVYGIKVVEQIPLRAAWSEHNRDYLQTKKNRFGHLLDEDF